MDEGVSTTIQRDGWRKWRWSVSVDPDWAPGTLSGDPSYWVEWGFAPTKSAAKYGASLEVARVSYLRRKQAEREVLQ